MIIDKHAIPTKLLWLDLEMTGLDTSQHAIVEVAAIVTDWDFNELATYEAVIAQPEAVLAASNEFALQQHTDSGLYEQVRTSGRPEMEVVNDLVKIIQEQFGGQPAVLAGNSIHADRAFIRAQWTEVEGLLHYRMLDVSSWKLVCLGKLGVPEFVKKETHRALDDIRESIGELQYYLDWFDKK